MKGDDVTVETFASDGEADSGTADDLTPVINSPPTAPAVEITPEDPKTLDDVTATVTTPSSDADGDAVQYTYEWYVNGSGPVFTDGPTSSTTSILDESHHVWTDDIHVVVTPNDGTEDGDTAQSNTVTVVNTPVVMSATSIDRLVGDENTDTFTATLEASDPDVDDGTQEYRYECDWSEGTPAVEETSAASVNFSKLYGFDGLFDVLGTVWDRPAGGGATLSTDSTLVATAEVLNVAPTLTISVDTATINEGDTATFTWNITDPGTDDNPPDFTPDVTWDFGDGSAPVTTSGLSGTVTHTYTQDSGCSGGAPGYSVTADTEDSDAAPDDDSLLMTVLNVAPTAVLETTDGPALREQAHRDGTDFTLSAASSSDVGAEDDASLEHEIVLVSYTPGPGRTAGDGPASTILPKGSATDVTVRLQLGVHVFELRTYDDCTVSTDTITLEVEDTTPPDIIPIQPADPSSLNVVGVPELEVITDATDICDEALDMQISNLVSTAGTTVADFNQFLDTLTEPDRHRAVTIPAADDILEITVCAVDDSGNLSEITYFVQIDATAPIVTIHSPVTTPKPSQPVEIFRNYTIARDCPEPNLGDESQFIPDDASECNPIPLIADAVDANPPSFPGPPHIGTGLNTDTYRVYVDGVEFYGPEVLALSGTIDGSPGQVVPVKPNVFLPPSKFADEGLNILGPHTLTIEVEDNAGNKGSASVDFEVVLVPIQAHIIVKNESTRGSEKGGVITFHVLNPMREYEGVVDRGNGPEFDGWKWEDVLQDPSTLVITSIYSGKSVVAESITKAGPLKYIVKARRKPLELDQEVGDDFVLQGAFPENCRWAGRDLTATHEDQDPRGPNPAGANKGGKK